MCRRVVAGTARIFSFGRECDYRKGGDRGRWWAKLPGTLPTANAQENPPCQGLCLICTLRVFLRHLALADPAQKVLRT